ncbi:MULTISPECIES: hypothetical protein [Bradyrhizobium]|uniref:Uncharacterized protein n=1 Tax=Bradyrhizobium ottawaense TaxID=931866 RepID=A0ABV4G6C1_9BRAD|nr:MULTISPECIES: hypothetical protein [Bradyrhizobium]MBR1291568.1 hypothetical protein [Bradyrhizobium ottawaense]MDA9413715.1 hypothetical protein [Bradyrhizobium sp. CCBAU 25360]PDT64571.1 hypothetical protein CO683_37555 [Bradyrhizobium ottawaense]WLB44192.1 hypothetical protein QIH93_27140 [Bradyrhizobium ottawaense]WQN81494.1 hypothetical protein U7859_31615 [Bradyrhizobium ottawaense]
MALLDDVIDASGGMARWNSLSRFTLHLSVGGTLFSSAGHAREFKDVTAEGSTRTQSVRFTGITGGEHSGSFQPDAITIESLDGEVLRSWRDPSLAFSEVDPPALADELHLVFFCGVAIWSYLTIPFLLAHPDVVIEELPPWQENAETWRRLRARFPAHLITLAPEQIFYFDESALQRRTDHDLFGMKVAHSSWAHDNFGGILVPTLRRAQTLRPDGTVIAKPVLMDVEIFDAVFE